jgi:RNA polymerase sigma-70 factor (ECF subfamily)
VTDGTFPAAQATDEGALIRQAQQDSEAFRQLYRRYFPRVYAYVAYRVNTIADAEDVVSSVFLHVVEALRRFEYRGEGSFAAWLFRIAYNEVQQHYRQQRRSGQVIALDDAPDLPGSQPSPDEIVQTNERAAQVRALLNTLSPRRRDIISLRFFAELRNQEIAVVLGLDERTVASHLSRGLDDLYHKLHQEAAHEQQ